MHKDLMLKCDVLTNDVHHFAGSIQKLRCVNFFIAINGREAFQFAKHNTFW